MFAFEVSTTIATVDHSSLANNQGKSLVAPQHRLSDISEPREEEHLVPHFHSSIDVDEDVVVQDEPGPMPKT